MLSSCENSRRQVISNIGEVQLQKKCVFLAQILYFLTQLGSCNHIFPYLTVEKDNLYRELWQACAGKLFYIPKQGDQVIYLPQPHIEEVIIFFLLNLVFKKLLDLDKIFCRWVLQVRAYADPDDLVDVPHNLPPAIHCSVANVELMVKKIIS